MPDGPGHDPGSGPDAASDPAEITNPQDAAADDGDAVPDLADVMTGDAPPTDDGTPSDCIMVTGTHSCASPVEIPEGGGEFCGDTRNTSNFYNLVTNLIGQHCAVPAFGPDYVFKLTSGEDFDLSVVVDADWQPAVYVRTTCTSASTQVACEEPPMAGVTLGLNRTLAAGTYYLILDGEASSAGGPNVNEGSFRMTVEITPR